MQGNLVINLHDRASFSYLRGNEHLLFSHRPLAPVCPALYYFAGAVGEKIVAQAIMHGFTSAHLAFSYLYI
jgi:hypothetical protein